MNKIYIINDFNQKNIKIESIKDKIFYNKNK